MWTPITQLIRDDRLVLFTIAPPVVSPPTLVSATPSMFVSTPTAPQSYLGVAFTGTFLNGAGGAFDPVSGFTFSGLTVLSSTALTVNIQLAAGLASGIYNLTFRTSAGVSNALPVTVTLATPPPPAPVIGSITPGTLDIPSTTTLVITGTGFSVGFGGGPPVVAAGGAPGMTLGTPFVVSDTEIQVSAIVDAAAAAGPRAITVRTDSGTSNSRSIQVGTAAPPATAPYRMVPRYKRPTP